VRPVVSATMSAAIGNMSWSPMPAQSNGCAKRGRSVYHVVNKGFI
jgi:hypothetical protein